MNEMSAAGVERLSASRVAGRARPVSSAATPPDTCSWFKPSNRENIHETLALTLALTSTLVMLLTVSFVRKREIRRSSSASLMFPLV